MSPDCVGFQQGIIQCSAAITRVLESPNCFQDASGTISVNSVLKCLQKPVVAKGTAKLAALDKFKTLMNCKPENTINENIDKIMTMEKKKRKKKDPLDMNNGYLKELITELNPQKSNIRL